MSTSITINGNTYEMNMVEITEEQFNILNEEGCESETWRELEEELMGDSLINGLTFSSDGANFSIYVNGEPLDISRVHVIYPTRVIDSQVDATEKTYQVVTEKYSKNARFHLEIHGEFNPKDLVFTLDRQALPDGSIQSVINPYYADQDFVFDESWSGNEETS